MIQKKFCIVGVDNDFIDFIQRNHSLFVGYFSNKKNRYNLIKRNKWLGDHNQLSWKKIKKKYNPLVIINIDEGKNREKLYSNIYKKNCKNIFFKNSIISKSSKSNMIKKKGIIVQDHVKIMPCVQINHGTKINIGAQIHHDCNIGKFATIAPKLYY